MKFRYNIVLLSIFFIPVVVFGQTDQVDKKANEIIQEIRQTMRQEDISLRIKVQSSPVTQNAKATKDVNGDRIILFNRDFLSDFNRDGVFKQRAYFILAHELAHHLNGDDFSTEDKQVRRQMEIRADSFAGRLLYYLCIDPKEVAQVMKNMPPDPTGTYLPMAQRMEIVRKGYEQGKKDWARVGKNPCDGEKMEPPMLLQKRFKGLNKAEGVSARIFHDSILIRYNVYPLNNASFEGRFAVSNKAKAAPDAKHFKWLSSPANFGTEKEAVWYFKQDSFSYKEVFNGDNFGLAIFKHGHTPKPAKNWRWWIGGILFSGGAALVTSGVIDRINAQSDYNQYKSITKPSVFQSITGTTRQAAYSQFNPVKKSAEWRIGLGAIPFALGGYFLIDNNNKRKHFPKDIFLFKGVNY